MFGIRLCEVVAANAGTTIPGETIDSARVITSVCVWVNTDALGSTNDFDFDKLIETSSKQMYT